MSDRPKWFPHYLLYPKLTEDGIEFYRTGLRAQLAVLEEIVHQPSYDRIAAKIALLRKELE